MKIERYELIVIGAGPAGLCAAIEAAKRGMHTIVFDENAAPGGQLFKQIHKFFGAKAHRAKIRGFRIGTELLEEATQAGVTVQLNATVMGLFDNKEITVMLADGVRHYKADNIVIATGARENMVPFTGWTKPGVIGAGAAQTMININGVRPGSRVLMVGSGNVGLVVSYQLLQAGIQVAAVIDAAPRIGGYGVHAAKLTRLGIPFYLSHTVIAAEGEDCVTGAVIAKVDAHYQPIPGTEKHLEVDTICMAVGLSPMSQLAQMTGCKMIQKGGLVPEVDENQETSIPGIFSAGDATGIEEASSAMIGGRIAGIAAAHRGGYLSDEDFVSAAQAYRAALQELHKGMFAPENRGRTDLTETDEGVPLSQSLLQKGYLKDNEVLQYPGVITTKGIHPVIECTQNIPCNPCQDACKFGCIRVGSEITRLPAVDATVPCTGCGMCVASCSGQAIFLVNEDYAPGLASVTIPYEFLPYPQKGDKGKAFGRDGQEVCEAEVISLRTSPAMDKTALLTMAVPKEYAMCARAFIRR